MEGAMTGSSRAGNCAFIVALFISFIPIIGCLESSFSLATGSRLPKWVTLPSGVTRDDISVTLSYYTALGGADATVTLRDKRGKIIAKVKGRMTCHSPFTVYPSYELVVINGITEVVEQKKMEPVFYITDDSTIKSKLVAGHRPCE
jgi:hypothetical protein